MHIVTKSVKEGRRLVSETGRKDRKQLAHRAHRRDINERLHILTQEVNHAAGMSEIRVDMQPKTSHMVTAWDIA